MGAQLIVGVPGNWKDRTEMVQSIAQSNRYLFAGKLFYNTEGKFAFEAEVYDHDPQMKNAFELAGRGKFGQHLLDRIDEHTCTVYLMGQGEGLQTVKHLVDAVSCLLDAGGMAVKIESTGVAFTKEEWEALCENPDPHNLYRHFVTLIRLDDFYCSFGMKSFGLPDAVVSRDISPQEAAFLLNTFNYYNLIENPALNSVETFSADPQSPLYRLRKMDDARYEGEQVFQNPHGLWKLERI